MTPSGAFTFLPNIFPRQREGVMASSVRLKARRGWKIRRSKKRSRSNSRSPQTISPNKPGIYPGFFVRTSCGTKKRIHPGIYPGRTRRSAHSRSARDLRDRTSSPVCQVRPLAGQIAHRGIAKISPSDFPSRPLRRPKTVLRLFSDMQNIF